MNFALELIRKYMDGELTNGEFEHQAKLLLGRYPEGPTVTVGTFVIGSASPPIVVHTTLELVQKKICEPGILVPQQLDPVSANLKAQKLALERGGNPTAYRCSDNCQCKIGEGCRYYGG